MKKFTAFLLAALMVLTMAACGGNSAPAANTAPAPAPAAPTAPPSANTADNTAAAPAPVVEENLTPTQKIIKEAEGMTLEELAKKAIEESNGKMFYGVGNSSRGKTALPLFIEYLKTII